MARYRKVDVRTHGDEKFLRLSAPPPCGQHLWLVLLTSPRTSSIPGLFAAGAAALAEDLGWPVDGFRAAFAELEAEGMARADWRARVVWLPRAVRYDPPANQSVIASWRSTWDEIPECRLKWEAWDVLRAFFAAHENPVFLAAFADACPEPPRCEPRSATPPLAAADTVPDTVPDTVRHTVPDTPATPCLTPCAASGTGTGTGTEEQLTPPPPLGAGGVAAVPAAPGQVGQDNSEGNGQGAATPPAPAPPPATPAKVAKPKAPPAPRRPLPVFAPELLAAIPDLPERWTRRIACTKPARRPTPSAEQSNVDRIAGWLATYGLDAVLAAIDQATDGGYMAVVEPKAGWKPAATPSRPVGTPSPVPQAPAAAPLDQLRKQAHRREYSRALEGLRPGELPPANVADALLAALEAATTPEAIAAVTLERVVAAELRAALPTLTPAQILSVGPLPPRRAAVDFAAIPAPPADNQAAAAIAALGLGD